jgi:hypothetical protein
MASTDMVGSLLLRREFDEKSCGIGVTEFLNQVNEVGRLNDWDDATTIIVARLKMAGSARLFRDHNESFKYKDMWSNFFKAMCARFTPLTNEDAKLFKHFNTSREENEFILDLLHALASLITPNPLSLAKALELKLLALLPHL